MKAEIVRIGTKHLLGDVLDTNSAYISRSLQEIGAELIYKVTVGDNLEHIAAALRIALARADLVLTTGGLGDQARDFTRQAVAVTTYASLNPLPQELEGSIVLGSQSPGFAGFILENLPGMLVCLPGSRREMAYLLETEVFPYLRARARLKSGMLILRTVGVMESSLRQQLADLPLAPNQWIGFDSFAGQSNIRLRVMADTEADIQVQLGMLRSTILLRLGDHVFGQDKDRLEAVILAMLIKGGYRVSVAECHTDHALSRLLLSDTAVADAILPLPVESEIDLANALHIEPPAPTTTMTQWCRAAAEEMVRKTAVNLGLLVYNDRTPGGVQLSVYLASAQGVSVTQRSFGGHPENINQWACTLGLAHLHRWLLAHP